MINNIKLLNFSLNKLEPILDKFYLKKGELIISENINNPTSLMKQNFDLLENISAYSVAKKNKEKKMMDKVIDNILVLIKNKYINYSEFVSFWAVVDISYSTFNKIGNDDQKEILQNIVEKYIELRHSVYSNYGYSPTTLQASKDAKAHKESGNLGINKVSEMLNNNGFQKSNADLIDDFTSKGVKKYLESDKKGKKLFKELLNYYGISFFWSSGKDGKMPDFLIRYKDNIFIVEHKHMKESGGGQDKQMNEIIAFIGFSEKKNNIHYVAFLDGTYFNLFSNKKYLGKGKILNQITNIKNNLEKNKQNYFVNTAGFNELMKEFY